MARKRKSGSSRAKSSTRAKSRAPASQDAIALLKADHRQVEGWFEQFESTRSDEKKKTLAGQICQALKVHTQIEEELFYPAFLEATGDEDKHHEAAVEHAGATNLISQIEASGPEDDYYDAKVKVLSEMIKHHVKEEEQRDGLFAEARQSKLDLKALGARLQARKSELMSAASDEDETPAARRRGGREGRGSREEGVMSRVAQRLRGN
jgi:hemerythrin HHE cation binding domain-containing protein